MESYAYPDGMLYRIEAENGTKAAVDQATDGPETAKDVNASEGAYVKNIGLNQGTVEVTLPDEVTNQNYCLNLCYSSSTSGAVNVWVNGEKHTVSYAKTNGSWSYVPETLLLGSFNLKAGDKIKIQDAKEGCFIWAEYVYLTKDTKTLTDVIAKAEALNLDNFEDGNAKNAFTEALANAKSVLANENSTQAVTDAKAIDLKKYQDGDVKEAFTNALAEAESALAAKELQEKVDAALKVLTAAQKMLAYVKLEPQEIDVAELQTVVNEAASAIAAAEAVDLTGYQDGNVKNAFRAALTMHNRHWQM